MTEIDPSLALHTVSDPMALGYVVVSNGRHLGGAFLTGAPREHCLFNDPEVVQAEYLYSDRATAEDVYQNEAKRWSLSGFKRGRLNFVPVEVVPSPQGHGGPANAFANAHEVSAPPLPDKRSQQFGMLWADAGWAGVETGLNMPPPSGSENRLCCVFIGQGLAVRIRTVP